MHVFKNCYQKELKTTHCQTEESLKELAAQFIDGDAKMQHLVDVLHSKKQ